MARGTPGLRVPENRSSEQVQDTVLLDVADLHVSYGGVRALRGVSLRLPPRGIVAVLGNNGAGKSTLLRALSGVLPMHGGSVDGGSIRLDGEALSRDPAEIVRAGVVQVPEGRRVFAGPDRRGEPARRRAGGRGGAAAGPARASARSTCSRGWPSAAASAPACCPAASSRCSRSPGRSWRSRGSCSSTSRRSDSPRRWSSGSARSSPRIREQGTAVVLVEQNAGLALDLADDAYVLEVGAVALHGPAAELAADRRGPRPLPRRGRRGRRGPGRRRAPWGCAGPPQAARPRGGGHHDALRRPGGAGRRLDDRRRRVDARGHRAQRRRQVHADQRADGRLPPERRDRPLRRGRR